MLIHRLGCTPLSPSVPALHASGRNHHESRGSVQGWFLGEPGDVSEEKWADARGELPVGYSAGLTAR
eukprot:4082355-Heterocapsa_arctica.AAC.1